MKIITQPLFAVLLACATPMMVQAQTAALTTASAPQAAVMSTGTIKKIDNEQAKMTISHGPLANLDMPAMTMVFRVAQPSMLGTVKVGDTIQFKADKVDGAFTVVQLALAK
ncbi:MAG: copper-binding protein [Herminiimonas sp.]|nr:copper-binding protein [Herminiimonas sp.]